MSSDGMIDDTDRKILRLLQLDGRMSVAALADQLGLSEAPCWRRVKRLMATGYIENTVARLNRRQLGYGVLAFVFVKFATHDVEMARQFEQSVNGIESILSCHNVTGEADYILQVVAKDLDDYGEFTMILRNLPGVTAINSALTLRETKLNGPLPV